MCVWIAATWLVPEDLGVDEDGSLLAQCGVMLCPRRILLAEVGVGV